MADPLDRNLWAQQLGFVALALVIIAFRLIPFQTTPPTFAPPDMILAIATALVVRRPDAAPVLLVAGVFFLADLMLQRPPGLYAAGVVLLTEFLRRQSRALAGVTFLAEWGGVATALFVFGLGYRFASTIIAGETPPITLLALEVGATILLYPVAVVLVAVLLGVRKTASQDRD